MAYDQEAGQLLEYSLLKLLLPFFQMLTVHIQLFGIFIGMLFSLLQLGMLWGRSSLLCLGENFYGSPIISLYEHSWNGSFFGADYLLIKNRLGSWGLQVDMAFFLCNGPSGVPCTFVFCLSILLSSLGLFPRREQCCEEGARFHGGGVTIFFLLAKVTIVRTVWLTPSIGH